VEEGEGESSGEEGCVGFFSLARVARALVRPVRRRGCRLPGLTPAGCSPIGSAQQSRPPSRQPLLASYRLHGPAPSRIIPPTPRSSSTRASASPATACQIRSAANPPPRLAGRPRCSAAVAGVPAGGRARCVGRSTAAAGAPMTLMPRMTLLLMVTRGACSSQGVLHEKATRTQHRLREPPHPAPTLR
jgi:hypothetical protein